MANYNYETLLVDQKDGILTITLNRPERLNAVDETMHKELETVFAEVGNDPEVSRRRVNRRRTRLLLRRGCAGHG